MRECDQQRWEEDPVLRLRMRCDYFPVKTVDRKLMLSAGCWSGLPDLAVFPPNWADWGWILRVKIGLGRVT